MGDGHDHDGDGHEHQHDEEDIVVLADGDGNDVEFLWLGMVELEEESFALLTPLDATESEESTEIYVFHYEQDEDGGEIFSDVEDEELLKKVQAKAEEMFSEAEEGED
jgi:uncharacterized protein YrzB (UPF0473 family)